MPDSTRSCVVREHTERTHIVRGHTERTHIVRGHTERTHIVRGHLKRTCIVRDLRRMSYGDALRVQTQLAADLKQGTGEDHLLFVEHPHVVTIGRNGHEDNVLATEALLRQLGIELHESDRGGDVTYHGPGQVVGYPIMDLRHWKRDVGAFVRGIEQVLIDTVAEFGIRARRIPKLTGVWVGASDETAAKIGAIGVHLSRWVSTHGWALNVATDLRYFEYIVPCGLSRPVTSLAALGCGADSDTVKNALARHFAEIFDFELRPAATDFELRGLEPAMSFQETR